MIMGLFSSGNSWTAQAARGGPRDRASREIIARHARQDKKAKKARAQRKADNARYGRRGRGILCGWAADD
jgi:hypothetical protein